jgi:hypothetical protein
MSLVWAILSVPEEEVLNYAEFSIQNYSESLIKFAVATECSAFCDAAAGTWELFFLPGPSLCMSRRRLLLDTIWPPFPGEIQLRYLNGGIGSELSRDLLEVATARAGCKLWKLNQPTCPSSEYVITGCEPVRQASYFINMLHSADGLHSSSLWH